MPWRHLSLLFSLTLISCAVTHELDSDASTDAAAADSGQDVGPGCVGPRSQCATSCDSDDVVDDVCNGGTWVCPPGSIDLRTCDQSCPPNLNPWDRDAPGSACDVEGATCGEGTTCGSAMSCVCESGSWNCAVAEPDPACWCGREPAVGTPCTGEVESCGQCCPTFEGPNWPPMTCIDNTWQPAACEEIVCPELLLECPVEIEPLLGTPCIHDAQLCGDACCSSMQCRDGFWQPGPMLGCACHPSPVCGSGTCTRQQSCNSGCGPADGLEYRCVALPSDCHSCECMPLQPGQFCEMVEGQIHIRENCI